jgi:uncharacterized surface protein with fasciclin (FAS1) repeats
MAIEAPDFDILVDLFESHSSPWCLGLQQRSIYRLCSYRRSLRSALWRQLGEPAVCFRNRREHKDLLHQVLLYHVIDGAFTSKDLTNRLLETVEGDTVEVSVNGGITVNGANVGHADITADNNGIIHVIDKVATTWFQSLSKPYIAIAQIMP